MPFSALKAFLRKVAERTIPRLRRWIGSFALVSPFAKHPTISGTQATCEIHRNML